MTQNRINDGLRVLQIVSDSTNSTINCNTAIPTDDTIPQQGTEGTEVITATITPISASSTLEIRYSGAATKDGTTGDVNVALFQDSTANALSATCSTTPSTDGPFIYIKHFMTSGTTSATTFKIKVGCSAGSCFVNGTTAGASLYGGVASSRLTIIEYL